MSRISVITDSTSDMPQYLCRDNDIIVIPLSVVFNSETYIDNGLDIKPQQFYEMMQHSTEMPKASQPTPGNFIMAFKELIKHDKEIISIHISKKLSGTINSAELAAKQLGADTVSVVDSELVHMSCGFMALKAAKLAVAGISRSDIVDEISQFRKKIFSFFIPKSLDNLIKGGRINKISGRLATVLDIKPILTLKNGEVSLLKNSRKWETTKKELLDSMERCISNKSGKKLIVSIGDVASKEEADEMEQRIRLRFNPEEVIRTNVGIVVGSHLGIGGIGVTFFEE